MRDLITYSKDVTLLLAEVEAKLPDYIIKDDQDKPIGFAITKTPTVRKGNETLSVVRCTVDEVVLIKTLTTMTILAEVAMGGDLLKAMTKAKRKLYNAVHDQTPQTITMEDGSTSTYTPPALIGSFA